MRFERWLAWNKEPCIRWGEIPLTGRAILGVVRPTKKRHLSLLRCVQQKGSFSPCIWHNMRCGLLSKFSHHLLNFTHFAHQFSDPGRSTCPLCVCLCVRYKWPLTYIFGALVHPDTVRSRSSWQVRGQSPRSQEENKCSATIYRDRKANLKRKL